MSHTPTVFGVVRTCACVCANSLLFLLRRMPFDWRSVDRRLHIISFLLPQVDCRLYKDCTRSCAVVDCISRRQLSAVSFINHLFSNFRSNQWFWTVRPVERDCKRSWALGHKMTDAKNQLTKLDPNNSYQVRYNSSSRGSRLRSQSINKKQDTFHYYRVQYMRGTHTSCHHSAQVKGLRYKG